MKNLGLIVAVLVLVGSLAFGGWKYARNEGWIAGSPASPRPENFKRALDRYLAHLRDPEKRACLSVGYPDRWSSATSFPDTRFAFTPAAYRARLGPETAPPVRERIELFARHGYLQARPAGEGSTEYHMTWKGFAASNGAGCFYLADVERDVRIVSFRRARVEKGGEEIWEVIAQPFPKRLEPWASDPAFRASIRRDESIFASVPDAAARRIFRGQFERFSEEIEPAAVAYELARRPQGFRVLGEKAAAGQQPVPGPASDAPPIAPVEPARVLALAEAYIAKGPGARDSYCMSVVEGADETFRDRAAATEQPADVTYYNLPGRGGEALRRSLAGYETLRRLESLGLARSELLPATNLWRQPTAGGVRYELGPALKALFAPGRTACIQVGSLHLEEVVAAQQFSATVSRPRFFARMRLKVPAGGEALAAKFGHLARMQDPGFPVQGMLQLSAGTMEVASLSYYFPQFQLEADQVRLPVVESAMPPLVAPGPASRGPAREEPRQPQVRQRPLRAEERVVRCGGDVIVCDAGDTVICGGRRLPCR